VPKKSFDGSHKRAAHLSGMQCTMAITNWVRTRHSPRVAFVAKSLSSAM
jgi:hypothetical protein